jgi:hypothetical protein
MLEQRVQAIDHLLQEQLSAIIENPECQRLVATWLGVHYLATGQPPEPIRPHMSWGGLLRPVFDRVREAITHALALPAGHPVPPTEAVCEWLGAGWVRLQEIAREALGDDATPNLSALGKWNLGLFTTRLMPPGSPPVSDMAPVVLGHLEGLEIELGEVSRRWGLASDSGTLAECVRFGLASRMGPAMRGEMVLLARLLLATRAAVRRGVPLWLIGGRTEEPVRTLAELLYPPLESIGPASAVPRTVTAGDPEADEGRPEPDFRIKEVRVGEAVYPLHRPAGVRYGPADDPDATLRVDGFGPRFVGTGEGLSQAFDDWRLKVHVAFQTLRTRRPFEQSADEAEAWAELERTLDLRGYERKTPVLLFETGRVSASHPHSPEISWWPDDRVERVHLGMMPAEFAAYTVGQWFEAVVERDRTTWKALRVRFVRPIEPVRPLSEEELALYWESLEKTSGLPRSERDWTAS